MPPASLETAAALPLAFRGTSAVLQKWQLAGCIIRSSSVVLCIFVQARRLNVEEDMKPVVDCLRSCGLEQAQIVKVHTEGCIFVLLVSLCKGCNI